jgi:hypothetical protein
MSARLTTEVWQASDLSADARLFLLALADICTDYGTHAEITFGALNVVDAMLGWEMEKVDRYARAAFGMEEDEPMGDASGTTFTFEDAVKGVRAL